MIKHALQFVRQNGITIGIILVAAFLHYIVILPSGSHYCFDGKCGDYYWGVQEQDGIWHVAIAQSSFTTIPPRSPSFSGAALTGYNSLLDFVVFVFSRIGLSTFFVYFKILPFIWFSLFTYTCIIFSRRINKGTFFLPLFLFLCYFGGSFTFLVPLIRTHSFNGMNVMAVMQPILTLTNLQLAFSYIVLLWIIIYLWDKQSTKTAIGIALLLACAWGLKFYTGLLSSVIVGTTYIFLFIYSRRKRNILFLLFSLVSSLVAIILTYNPFSHLTSGGSPLSLSPLALVWPLIEDPSSFFYSPYLANAKYVLISSGGISPRLILIGLYISLLYLILNFGPRIAGFLYFFRHKPKAIDSGILTSIIIGTLCALLLVQRGVWWNIVQFIYIVFFLLSIYLARYVAQLTSYLTKGVICLCIIICAIPYTVGALMPYSGKGYIYVSDREQKALAVLRAMPDGIVYIPLFKPFIMETSSAKDIWMNGDSAYVAAYTGKQLYFQKTGAVLLANDYKKRESMMQQGICAISHEIRYVYINIRQSDEFYNRCVYKNPQYRQLYGDGFYFIYDTR